MDIQDDFQAERTDRELAFNKSQVSSESEKGEAVSFPRSTANQGRSIARQCLCGLVSAIPFHYYCGALCYAPIAIAAIFIFRYIENNIQQKVWAPNAYVWFLSLLFTLFVGVGDSCCCELNNITPLPVHCRLLSGMGIFIALVYALSFIFSWGDSLIRNAHCFQSDKARPSEGRAWLLTKRPFLAVFLLLCVFYIPIACLMYPGILMQGSSFFSIVPPFPGMNLLPDYYGYHAYSPMVLNNHHPVVHTLLLHYCIRMGHSLVNDASAGLFTYTLVQVFFCLSSIAYALSSLFKRIGLKTFWVELAVLFFLLHPIIVSYMFIPTKDVMYSGFMLYFATIIGNRMTGAMSGKTSSRFLQTVGLCIVTIGVVLFRSEGIIIASAASFALLFAKTMRTTAVFTLSVALVTAFAKGECLHHAGVVPGMAREAFSVPVQQTARCLKEFPEDVTAEDLLCAALPSWRPCCCLWLA